MRKDAVEVGKGLEHKGFVYHRKEFRFVSSVCWRAIKEFGGKGVMCLDLRSTLEGFRYWEIRGKGIPYRRLGEKRHPCY